MLWLAQAAPALPPIYVTVQQPPGLPTWVTILISAGVGAVSIFVISTLMEFMKPQVTKYLLKRKMARHLGAEVLDNVWRLERALNILEDWNGKSVTERQMNLEEVIEIQENLPHGQFDHYNNSERDALLELRHNQALLSFYLALKTRKGSTEYAAVSSRLNILKTFADDYVKKAGLKR